MNKKTLISFIVAVCSFNARAAIDPLMPGLPLNAKYYKIINSDVSAAVIKTGNKYIISSDKNISSGGIFGLYDPGDISASTIILSLPFQGVSGWNFSIGTGIFFEVIGDSNVYNTLYNTMVLNPLYPFRWQPLSLGILYNRVQYATAEYPNYLGNKSTSDNPRGVQVQPRELPVMAQALINHKLVKVTSYDTYFKSIVGGVANFENAVTISSSDQDHINASRLTVSPYDGGVIESVDNGTLEMSSKKDILSAPAECRILLNPKGIICPFDLLLVPAFISIKANNGFYFVNSDGTASTQELAGGAKNKYLFYSVEWLNNSLGNNKEVVLKNTAVLSLYPRVAPQFVSKFDYFGTLKLKRVDFQVSVTERSPAAAVNGYYQGIIGKNSNITIPYTIKQSGVSKATKVTMTVTGESTNQDGDGRQYCKFVSDSQPVQNIAVPLSLAFSKADGSLKKQIDWDCTGRELDITSMPWSETAGGNQYMSELWLDMIFNLSSRRILNDINGKYWAGSAKAKGSIKVTATWNN